MAESAPQRNNPFVGPRAIQTGERLYGRDRENNQLTNLLIAERIVLLYSPSGAGKTSLVQAALLPRLAARKFTVMPVARVNLEPDSTIAGTEGFNRYIYSVISSMEEGQPEGDHIPVEDLAGMRLGDYLDQRGSETATVLIFDQFEEILTFDPTDHEAKEEFFVQLGEALRVRSRYALFSMREDYIAGLDPYLLPIPTRLSTTFRLDLLTKDTSKEVIQQIAKSEGVEFTDDAAAKMIDDLCRVQVQQPDGSIVVQSGQYVEPVQMQVVCFSLWEKMDPGDTDINIDDVEKIGDVDESLAEYYCMQVSEVGRSTGVKERVIREWVDVALITESGIRGQVLMGLDSSEGLENEAIFQLVDAHLVRRDTRRGTTWFELAHDRLIGPVRRDNAGWFQENLSLLQRQASLWKNENKPDHLLLRERSLVKAEEWAADNQDDMTPTEQEFLEACQEARQREVEERERQEQAVKLQEQQRLAKVLRGLLMFAVVAAIVAGALAVIAFFQSNENASLAKKEQAASTLAVGNAQTSDANEVLARQAEATANVDRVIAETAQAIAQAASTEAVEQRDIAEENAELAEYAKEIAREEARLSTSRQLAAQAVGFLDSQPDLAALLAVEAAQRYLTTEAKNALLSRLQVAVDQSIEEFGRPIRPEDRDIFVLVFSPDGERVAWGMAVGEEGTGEIVIYNIQKGEVERRFPAHEAGVFGLAFSPDGRYLVSGGNDAQIFVWDLESGEFERLPDVVNVVRSVDFSPDGQYLAAGVGSQISIYEFESREKLRDLRGHNGEINRVVWSPDGTMLATASPDRRVMIWNPDVTDPIITFDNGHTDIVYDVAWAPDSNMLASVGRDRQLFLWDVSRTQSISEPLRLHNERPIRSVAFSPDGRILATGGGDNTIFLSDVLTQEPIGRIENFFPNDVVSIAFRPGLGKNLLGGASLDGRVGLFTIAPQEPLGYDVSLDKGEIIAVTSIGEEFTRLAGRQDGEVNIWDIDGVEEYLVDTISSDTISSDTISAAFSPDGENLALGERNGEINIYDVENGELVNSFYNIESPVLALAYDPAAEFLASSQCLEVWYDRGDNEHCDIHDLLLWEVDGGTPYLLEVDQSQLSGQNESEIIGHTDFIRSLAFWFDGSVLATGGDDRTIVLWDLVTIKPLRLPLTQPKSPVTSLSFSPDGNTLASGGHDQSVLLWDIFPLGITGQASERAEEKLFTIQPTGDPLTGALGSILSLAFSPDNMLLYSGDQSGTLMVWNVSPENWAFRNCQLAGRSLTQNEWDQFFPEEPDIFDPCEGWLESQ